jgi:tRNA threonylcarbamoyl adenosine modification protein YeaZ
MAATVLGFDTSAAHCAAAIVSNGRILAERAEPMARGQAERLMPLLEEVLAEAGLGWADLDALGVGTGPGNFTGTRIAVAAARGLSLALAIPAEGVTSPQAWGDGAATVCLAAPRGEVHHCHAGRVRTGPPGDLPTDWPRRLRGPEAACVAEAANGTVEAAPPLAVAIARRAAAIAGAGRPRPAPVYLRPADAAPPADPPPRILPA